MPCPGARAALGPGVMPRDLGVPGRGGSRCPEPLPSCRVPAVVRKLQEFELPYVSVTSLRDPEFRIILRKR